jgi:phage-related holin
MTIPQVAQAFVDDSTFQAVLVLIALDLVLGVTAAVKLGQFTFAKVAGFCRDDLLGKVVPWFAVYCAWKFAPNVDVLGVDLEVVEKGVFVFVVAALVGSLLSSLSDLGLKIPDPLSKGENS